MPSLSTLCAEECALRKQRQWVRNAGLALKSWYSAYVESLLDRDIYNVYWKEDVLHVLSTNAVRGAWPLPNRPLPDWLQKPEFALEKSAVLLYKQCDLSLAVTHKVVEMFQKSLDSPLKKVSILAVESPQTVCHMALHLCSGTETRNDQTSHVLLILQTLADDEWALDITAAQYGITSVTHPKERYLTDECVPGRIPIEYAANVEWEALVRGASDGDEFQALHVKAGRHFFEIVKAFMEEQPEFLHLENGPFEESLMVSTARVRSGMDKYHACRCWANACVILL
ncbi:hypothetical protein BU16DRAFT_567382 [Lophium mytilinum]|uniref:Uncharacterized protein n=1 Tax=Lophium mytilinum TaxID=390894 RepID=A0A6A6QAX4_9PEZI|nr:hypothetical protein BU16DRAFT_567382 [Lophium mytilinum]